MDSCSIINFRSIGKGKLGYFFNMLRFLDVILFDNELQILLEGGDVKSGHFGFEESVPHQFTDHGHTQTRSVVSFHLVVYPNH